MEMAAKVICIVSTHEDEHDTLYGIADNRMSRALSRHAMFLSF
jgi:hypothetical protein